MFIKFLSVLQQYTDFQPQGPQRQRRGLVPSEWKSSQTQWPQSLVFHLQGTSMLQTKKFTGGHQEQVLESHRYLNDCLQSLGLDNASRQNNFGWRMGFLCLPLRLCDGRERSRAHINRDVNEFYPETIHNSPRSFLACILLLPSQLFSRLLILT